MLYAKRSKTFNLSVALDKFRCFLALHGEVSILVLIIYCAKLRH